MVLMLDSNIIIDRLLKREPHYETSSRVCLLGVFGDAQLYLSVNMLSDIFYILRKRYDSHELQELLLETLRFIRLCGLSAADGMHCLRQQWHDLEDCLVARCAENIKADYIITRNKKDFAESLVPTLSPEELLALLKNRDGLSYCEQ
jgi:predicted nucleic acid-binding protein